MLLPLSWLQEYTDVTVSPVEFANGITDSGSHVDSIGTLGKPGSGIITGLITEIAPHPDADRLKLVTVDLGDTTKTLVTAAPNVQEGKYVPVALEGAVLADGTRIAPTEFRGIISEGMLCSLEEMGLSDNVIPKEYADGIFLFEDGTPGAPFHEVIGLEDAVLEIEVTPNRPDCLSIIGMARESAATFQTELRLPEGKETTSFGDIEDYLTDIRLESDGCIRYMGRVIQDVAIQASPRWMQNRLMQAGMRPINNIVDITNYVMLEMGIPLHAFDIDKVKDKTIVVRQAEEGERLLLLNGTNKTLSSKDLVIADSQDPIGLAGIMGGFDSEITDKTKNILIECAVFDSDVIRTGAKRHGLRSEASSRYEKGLVPGMIPRVMDRVCQLAEEIGVGKVVGGYLDRNNDVPSATNITVDVAYINRLLGTELSEDTIRSYLTRLFLEVGSAGDALLVTVPAYRSDLRIPADIAEEVARLHGLANIAPKPVEGVLTEGGKMPIRLLEDRARQKLYGLGFSEALTYSFISEKAYDRLGIPAEDPLRNVLKLMNPLGEDFSVMRTTLLPNMLDIMEFNAKNGREQVWMYELGNTFTPGKDILPEERRFLAFGMYGEDTDFYTMKSAVSELLRSFGIEDLRVEECRDKPWYHPGRSARLYAEDKELGSFGEISYAIVENVSMTQRLYLGEFNFETIAALYREERNYTPINRYPSMKRDLALVVDKEIRVGDVLAILRSVNEKIIQSIHLFDVYEGEQLPEGKKSLAFQVEYQDPEQTLKEEDAARVHAALVRKAEEALGASLRA